MSLSVKDRRSGGKSPGRERSVSRSRDYRAPSPPEIRPKKSSKESSSRPSKKYYSDESESDRDRSRKPVSSKKYYDDDSDSDPRSRAKPAPTKKYYEDDYSDDHGRSGKHSSSRRYDDDYRSDDSRSQKTRSTKKYYDSESDSDRRKAAARTAVAAPAKPTYEVAEPKRRRASPPDTRETTQLSHKVSFDEASGKLRSRRVSPPHSPSMALTRKESFDEAADAIKNRRAKDTHSKTQGRKDEYSQPSKPHYDERYDERHDPSRPSDYLRRGYSNESSGSKSPETKVPGQYKWEYDHDRPTPRVSGPDHDRGISVAASGNFNVGIGSGHSQPHHGYATAPSHPAQPVAQPQHRLEPQRIQPNSVANTSMYADLTHAVKYAELPQHISYSNPKIDDRKPTYTQSSQPQFVEMKPQYSTLQPNHTETLGPRMHRLSVSGGVSGGLSLSPGQGHGHIQGALPPGSPLLEAYHGTYQSISPMPSPLMLPSTIDDDPSDIDRFSSDESRRGTSHKSILKKRVEFYDAEDDAVALAAALKHTKPDPEPFIKILPRLSDENVLELRTEYKKHYKVSGKGINIAKHIKMKVPGNFGKIAYAVALGRWESEAHWANFWYQSNTSRRELLIESLIGRSNSEIAKIKEKFSDKRYNDSLEKCMQTELKKDKFRTAILLALEQRRMEECEKISTDLVRRDVQDLYRALTSKEGGETAMINIIVVRSDNHLREVLRSFEATYRKNFAREMIQKSRNLVVSRPPTHNSTLPLFVLIDLTRAKL